MPRRSLRRLDYDRGKVALGLDGGRTEDRIQGEASIRVVWSALDPAAQAIDRAGYERQGRIAGGDLCVHESTITAGAAVGRELQIVVENLLNAAVGVRFPDGATPALRALVKNRLAPSRESQIDTPLQRVRDLAPVRCCPRSNAHLAFMPCRRCVCNSKVGVKDAPNNVEKYHYCQKNLAVGFVRCGRIDTVALLH